MESLGEIYTAPYDSWCNVSTSTCTVSVIECRVHYNTWNTCTEVSACGLLRLGAGGDWG